MADFFGKILTWVKSMTLREWILMALVAALAVVCTRIYLDGRTRVELVSEQSQTYKNAAEEEYRAKTILLQEVSDLRRTNDSLYEEYVKIKDANPLVITRTVLETRVDTLTVPTYIEHPLPNRYDFKWSYAESLDTDNYFSIKGMTTTDSLLTQASTVLENMSLGSDIVLNLVEGAGENSLRIVARSNNPRVTITNIEGAVIDPTSNPMLKSCFKPKRWGLGVQLGVGTGYDINSGRLTVGPQLTVGVNYNILTW